MDRKQKNDMTERTRGLGRKASEKIGKWNQMTALRCQTGDLERHQISSASQWGDKTMRTAQLPTAGQACKYIF